MFLLIFFVFFMNPLSDMGDRALNANNFFRIIFRVLFLREKFLLSPVKMAVDFWWHILCKPNGSLK